jgi:hypothetical protein
MNNEAMKEVLNELFSHLEKLETQNEAILQFLKEKKRVTDKQLAPYLEQAGNASNVKWRAARIRIDHLLSPEHPEEEIKLGKQPELHEEPAHAGASEADSVPALSKDKRSESDTQQDKRGESIDKEEKKSVSGDQKQIESSDKHANSAEPQNADESGTDVSKKEKPAPVEAVQARPIDGKKDKPEEKSEPKPRNTEQPMQDQLEQKSDSDDLHHPTEVTEPLARKEGAEPAAQLKPDKTDSGKEAA